MAARLNKTRLTAKPSVPGPLRAKHSIPRPSPLDQAKVAEVASLCRKLEILVGRNPPDAKIVDTLLTPSPQRFQLLCKTFQGFCPELEEELEELKPAPKVTLEEARFRHLMEFCQDAGLFDDGDDVDLLKIKGELPDNEHLNFWLYILRTADMMSKSNRRNISAEDLIATAEELTEVAKLFEELNPIPDKASLLHGALLEKIENEAAPESYSVAELRKMVSQFDSELRNIQNAIMEMEEEDAEDSVVREDPPEKLSDDTSITKLKLLQGNLKDLIHTFLAMYDASLKNAVAAGKRIPVETRPDLENLLLDASKRQESLLEFVEDVRRILQRLTALRAVCQDLSPTASAMASENSECLALNLQNRVQPDDNNNFDALRAVYGDAFD